MSFCGSYLVLPFIMATTYAQCGFSPDPTCHSINLTRHPTEFISAATIQIKSTNQFDTVHQLYFDITEYQCINPTLTISNQEINPFTIEYVLNYATKAIQCISNKHDCSYTFCVSDYVLSDQNLSPNTIYPIIMNISSANHECDGLYSNANVTLICSNNNVNPHSSDWSDDTTNTFKLWFKQVTNYVSYGDRWIYFSIIGTILLCICCCCCVAYIRQCRQKKKVKMHPKPKFAKVKVKKAKKAHEYDEVKCEDYSIPMVLKNKNGTIYLQTSYFSHKQLKNIQKAFGDSLKEAPKILFGDNYADKHRPKHVKHRHKSAGQSKVMGKYDRKYGFGIPTTFDDAKEYGFKFSDKNFSKMIENEFKILHKHLLSGGDVIIPSPTKKDLKDRPQKYFKDGNYNSNQLIFHNLGTGISSLAFQNLLVIQKNIDKLNKSGFDVVKVKQKLYDQPYYSEDESDSDQIIEESLSVFLQSEENPCKDNTNSSTQGEINDFARGLLIFQTAWYSEKQMQHIRKQCKSKSDVKKVGKMLFGDNDTDKFRGKGVKRLHFGGQASVMGCYDKLFAHGIVTTFVHNNLPEIGSFMLKIDQQFQPLQQHLLNGYDVIIPKPRKQDIIANKKNYYKNGKQMVFHNIGTGIASLPFEYVAYIQQKIDELKKYARATKTVKYYTYSANNMALTVQNNKEIYYCPICSRERHYLINLKKCTHSICEECLCDYLCRHLVYENNPMEQRFQCWAVDIGKCKGRICLEDIRYTDDRCRCEKCAQNSSDTGTDTILDIERYKQFVNIMKTFDIKCKWDKTECPNCFKPFPVSKPWQQTFIDETDADACTTTGYDIEYAPECIRKQTVVSKNTNCCNCCGNKIINKQNQFYDDEKEVCDGFNNCGVCNYYYCDHCRRNCFYEIGQITTMRRPLPIENAMIDFNIQQQLRQSSNANESHIEQSFECCEICWFKYYCRACPHCKYIHCARCNSEWEGCTQNWSDKFNENMFSVVDEENHSNKKKHFCKAKTKMADFVKKKKAKREKNKDNLIRTFAKAKEESEYKLKQQQILYQKQLKQTEKLQKENALWKSKVLESENIKLEKEKNEQEIHLKKTRFEKEQFRVKAENVEKKVMEFEKENKELRKKVGYIMTWQWHDYGKIWKSYDYNINKAIEKLKINESYTYLCAANKQNYKITKTLKSGGTQINIKTKVQRNIRRQKIERGLNVIQYPKWWNMSDFQLMSEPGASVNATYAKPKIIEMDLNKFPAKDVVTQFYKTAKGYTIIKIESVQNQMLYDAYYGVKSKLLRLVGSDKLNERNLFHGTRTEDVMGLIGKEGFRKEFNKTAAYGKGTYFARDATYSVDYSSNNNGIYKMFQCKVLCAESCLGKSIYELNKWPKKQNGSGLIYDSLVDNTANPSIFVIHDDVRAYPTFVIHFKKV